ncbi:MAG: alpha/beta fold hydrolase [Janthinobacterium lividum]
MKPAVREQEWMLDKGILAVDNFRMSLLVQAMTPRSDVFIQSGAVRLAVQDYGGSGSLVLLLHGAGRSAADWLPMTRQLTSNRHVVALDLRGHGLSESGEWTADTVLEDIQTVLQTYSSADVSILGHSLGGVLAFLYARKYGGIRRIVDLDGFALCASEYVGMSAAQAMTSEARARAGWLRPQAALTGQAVAALERNCREASGLSQADGSEIIARMLVPLGDDRYSLRTDTQAILGIRDLYDGFLAGRSFFDLVRAMETPSLIFRAGRLDLPPKIPEWYKDMLQAYHLGVQKQTDALQESSQFMLSVRESSHMMMLEEPDALAAEIHRFLDAG